MLTSLQTLPRHKTFVEGIIQRLMADGRFDALLGAGSLIHGGLDSHSDLDLVLVVRPDSYGEVMSARTAFAEAQGALLASFTGEHVGEPRLLICLYGPELLHVDLKFVRAADLSEMVEHPVILWARARAEIGAVLEASSVRWPDRDPQWFEDRAWVWLHYGATKLQRGEFFEAISMLGFFREQILGPLLLRRHGRPQRSLRRIEGLGAQVIEGLKATHPTYDAVAILAALEASIELYLDLRRDHLPPRSTSLMPEALLTLLKD